MNPITGLLEQHWQQLQDLRTEYWGYALSTTAADRERLEHAITSIYKLNHLRAPQVVWLNSLLDAKLLAALGTYISDPNVYFSLRGPFGRWGGKEGFVTMHTPADEKSHKEKLQREFPTHYTETPRQQQPSKRIRNAFWQPALEGAALYQALQGSVGVVPTDPFKIVLSEFGRLPAGVSHRVNVMSGDMHGDPLPGILDMVDSAFGERFEHLVAEFDETQWLDLWHQYQFQTEKWRGFGPQLRQMSRERRAEVMLFLRRITALQSFGCFSPIRDAICCARNEALEIMGQGEYSSKLAPFTDAVKAGGWWWPSAGVCFAFDNPAQIHLDGQNRLHNEDGMAIRFRDNWGLWAVHGVRVPEIVVRNQFSAAHIDAEPNAEVRRVMLSRYGISRYAMESGAEEIDKDEFGKLYRKTLPDGQAIGLVEVINTTPEADGSQKMYHLCVPPDITSARAAVAWTFGLSAQEYAPVQET